MPKGKPDPTPKKWMTHLNGHPLCAIDCETTGLDSNKHMAYQIAIIPLDARLLPRQDVNPFDIYIRPTEECLHGIV